jgi:ribonuclease Z
LFENEQITIHAIPLDHSIPTAGFIFAEKQLQPNFIKDKILEHNIPISAIHGIKAGADFVTESGEIIPHTELTREAPAPRKYAYCSDTHYKPSIVQYLQGVDMLYHESTFTEKYRENANFGLHSTALDAAKIASAAGVGMLILGHYSARFSDATPLLEEAKTIFEATYAGQDGLTFFVPYRQ